MRRHGQALERRQCPDPPESPHIDRYLRPIPRTAARQNCCKYATYSAQLFCIVPTRSGVRLPLAPCDTKPLRMRASLFMGWAWIAPSSAPFQALVPETGRCTADGYRLVAIRAAM